MAAQEKDFRFGYYTQKCIELEEKMNFFEGALKRNNTMTRAITFFSPSCTVCGKRKKTKLSKQKIMFMNPQSRRGISNYTFFSLSTKTKGTLKFTP